MSRKDFISDHLVDMRDGLRDSYTSYHLNRAVRELEAKEFESMPDSAETDNIETPSAPETTIKTPPPHPEDKYLPSMRNSNDRSADTRARRELEGRIIHDLAAVDSEREKLKCKMDELEKFAAVLSASRKLLVGEDGDLNKIGRDYYAARGRWSSFEERYEIAATEPPQEKQQSEKGFWIIAASVLLGSLIVAVALIKAFSV